MKNANNKYKKAIYIIPMVFALLIIIYLYFTNIIFVKYTEHGLLTNKMDLGDHFKYEIHINGKQHFFITKDKSIDLAAGVVNFKSRRNRIVEFIEYVIPINEKIMSKSQSSMELEYSGDMDISDILFVYKISGGNISNKTLSSIMVGAKNIKVYRDKSGSIRTAVIDGDTNLNFMRVGIKTEGFQSFLHSRAEFISKGSIKVQDKIDNKSTYVPPNTKIILTPVEDGILLRCGNITEILKNRVYISPEDNNNLINTLAFERGHGTPSYRGFFEITKSEDMLRLINELDLESYLYQVVPSEMPSSFGLEALKAQAVAARTYAISDLLSGRYASKGFHVDDSTMSQVYNNISENPLATLAVNDTIGLIMKYGDELVDAKYYSTSHGYGANSDEIWSSNGIFPGIKKPYLTASTYLLDGEEYNLSSEDTALRFFKDWSLKSYDSHSPYFRWKVTLSREELKNTIEKNLPLVYEDQKNYVLTLKNGKFESLDIPNNCIGDLIDMKVTRRGNGGNIMELAVSGTNGTYKIIKELNVRYLIRPRKSDTGFDNDIMIKRIEGRDLKNSSLLPSAFMSFEINRDSLGEIKDVTFYGGGYGHSVGMSQYGAGYLSSKGNTFDEILKIYYKDITIEKLYE